MATSALSLANRSLLSVGARAQISSFSPSDGSDEANAVSVLWTPTFEQLGRAARWNCLRRQAQLTLYQAAQGTPENPDGTTFDQPPTPWLYAYIYPSDCLSMQFIVPSLPVSVGSSVPATTINNNAGTWLPSGGQIPYVVQTSYDNFNNVIIVILTNQDQAQAVYTVNQSNPVIWDSMFQQAFVSSLAAYLVPALSLSIPLMQIQIQNAEKIITQARVADGNEGVTVMDHLPDWMQARAGGQGFGLGFYNWGGYCYNMNWPDGAFNYA